MKAIYICSNENCGERMEGKDTVVIKHCSRCKTAKGREEVAEENLEIKQNREKIAA